jgi:non-specific serine/threonine protein kinase
MELALSPQGHIYLPEAAAEDDAEGKADAKLDRRLRRIGTTLGESQAEGLFLLAAERVDGSLPMSWSYWRDFASKYVTALCQRPGGEELEALPPPDAATLDTLVLKAPPMAGAEYLNRSVLESLWKELDRWGREQIAAYEDGLSGFLKDQAPLWHQVGRICFHLAENRRDEDYPFAFLATYASGVGSTARVQYKPLSKALQEFHGAKRQSMMVKLLSPVQAASRHSPMVKELVDSGDIFQPLAWTPSEAYEFLKAVPVLEANGFLVRIPDWWKKRPRPQVSVQIGDATPRGDATNRLLDFKVEVALGDETISEAEWQRLLASEDGLVLLKGQWVEVDRQRLEQTLEHWKQAEEEFSEGISFIDAMRQMAGVPTELADTQGDTEETPWAFVQAGNWLGDLLTKLRDPESLATQKTDPDFKAKLRPYQETGVEWLRFLSELGLGACLADDMGLGKTIQVLALLSAMKSSGGRAKQAPSLLVLPASLLANWRDEMNRFAPRLRARFIHPAEESRETLDQLAADPDKALRDVDLCVTTYGMLVRQTWLVERTWRLAILDEAQAIKNPSARQTRAVKQLKAQARIALTGTPIENRLGDLWSLFDFLCPGLLGSAAKFKRYVKQLSKNPNGYAGLRRLVQPYILRRLKTDRRIINDLPDKVEVETYCGLTKRQATLYAKLVQELSELLKNVDGMKRRGAVLAYLLRFKQLCNHPSLMLGDGVFLPDQSGKLARLAELCEEMASRQERVLVFTQFREMTDPLASFLADVFGRPGLILHGDTPVKQRRELVGRFQAESGPPFFVLSLKAGGTGLNLTAASHVIHFDRWWNPAVENQATDRAFRIGQKRNVLVHKFICRGTVEDRIAELIDQKRHLADELLEGSAEQMLTEMNDAELIRFVSLDLERTAL